MDEGTNLLESSVRSVWDSNEEVLGWGAVSLLVVNGVDTVDENDLQVSLEGLVVALEHGKGFGDFFLQIGWLNSVFLDYLISSIEHVCLLCVALRNVSSE